MATQSITPEKTNYARLCVAINEICAESLRDLILSNILPGFQDTSQAISYHRRQLQQHLDKYQYSVLFQNHQLNPNFSVSECDMSLLYSLIRNVTSVPAPLFSGWGTSFINSPQDNSLGANVERLHKLRNTVIHLKEPRLSNQDFSSHWTEMRKCVADIETILGGTKYQQRLDCLKMDDMDPEYANRQIEIFRSELQCLQDKQHQQGQVLLDLKAEQRKGFDDMKVNSEKLRDLVETNIKTLPDIKISNDCQNRNLDKVLDLLNDPKHGLYRIAEGVKEINEKQTTYCNNKDVVKGIHKLMECRSEETGQKQLQLNSVQEERTENNTSNHDVRESENITDTTNPKVEKTDVDEDSNNEYSAAQVQLEKNDSDTEANQYTIGGKEIGDIDSGLDGKLCIIKQYAFIKSNLPRESGLVIAKYLWEQKLLSQDAYHQIGNTCCARRHPIDILLKKVVHGGSDEMLGAFFKILKVECPEMARAVKETKITHMDRLRFVQLQKQEIGSEELLPSTNSSIDDRDIKFFRYHLCESEEIVDYIADVMLSRMHLSVLDHSIIIGHPLTVEKISALFNTLQSRSLDVALELQDLLKPKLYQDWILHRRKPGRWQWLLGWLCSSESLMNSIFEPEEMEFDEAEIGSIILKFHAGRNFSVDLLNPESLKRKIRILLKTGCLENKTELKSVAHVTVYIKSPGEKGREDIHIYINFDDNNVSIATEDHQAEMRIRNINIMSEEMNPTRLKEWMFDQPCIQKPHRDMLESKLKEHWHSRQEEMTVLLDIIYGLESGNELLEKYCEKNDPYVYNKVFGKRQEFHFQEEDMLGQRTAVSYEKGGGLQKLFSFSMIIDDEASKRLLEETKVMSEASKRLLEASKRLLEERTLPIIERKRLWEERTLPIIERKRLWEEQKRLLEETKVMSEEQKRLLEAWPRQSEEQKRLLEAWPRQSEERTLPIIERKRLWEEQKRLLEDKEGRSSKETILAKTVTCPEPATGSKVGSKSLAELPGKYSSRCALS